MPDLAVLESLALPAAVLLATLAWLAARSIRLQREVALLLQAQEAEARAGHRAATRAAWLDAALETLPEGVLVADRFLRAIHWNHAFATLSGLPEDTPREGPALAALLRLSAEAGEFGLVDVDQEVAHQLALVAAGPAAFPQLRHRPDGAVVEFHLHALPGGAILLRCADVTARHRMAGAAPAAPAPVPQPPAAPPPDPVALAPRQRRCLVLLVEDMEVNRMVTATQLRRDGHRVDVAASGAEALRLAAGTPYDLVLMDLMMPGMSGYEAAGHLRALPGLAGHVPILALTANTGEEERARCLAAGMQGMLSKPVPAAALRDVLQQQGGAPARPAPAPDPGLPDPGLLDTARLAELRRDLPPAVLATLFRQCLDDMGERLRALDAALEDGGADGVEREAHALAGMAASYGLAQVERLARAVLASARRVQIDPARTAARGLAESLAGSRAALLAWLAA